METALTQIEGTYGIAVVSTRDPGKIVVARLGSPLLIGVGENGETFVASDAAAVIAHTRDVIYLDDGDMATITKGGYTVHRPKQGPVSRPINRVDWDLSEVERGGYDALHAQGDHGAAGDAARDHARAPAGGRGRGEAGRPDGDGRRAARRRSAW